MGIMVAHDSLSIRGNPGFPRDQSGLRPLEATEVHVEVVDSAEGLLALAPDYERLQAVTGNTLPFALHDWHIAWWKHFPKPSGSVRDDLRIYVARDDGGSCVGLVPFVLTRRGRGALSVRTLAIVGPDPNITEIRGPLVARGFEAPTARAVHAALAADNSWDWIHWSCVGGAFGEALVIAGPIEWEEPVPDYVLDLAPTWEEFRGSLKRNIRESLRHCYNSLKRDALRYRAFIAQTPAEVRAGVDTFLRLHAIRGGVEGMVAHADRFQSESARAFLYDVCDRLARRGIARVVMLEVEGQIVAARIAFVLGTSMYLYYSGFDPRWGKYSVMTTVVAEAIKHAIEQGLTTVNLSTGTDVSKTRWGARAVPLENAVERRDGLRSRLAYAAYQRAMDGGVPPWATMLLGALPKRNWKRETSP
jgi:CelD/BcsL family acetyltransferase involved in cellulose biosynthesis